MSAGVREFLCGLFRVAQDTTEEELFTMLDKL